MMAEQWIMQVEKMFEILGPTAEQKVELVIFMFEEAVEH